MINANKAAKIVVDHQLRLGSSCIDYLNSLGRVLDEPIVADRAIPPFNRATMDGIAINLASLAAGDREYEIVGVQAAGAPPMKICSNDQCLQIMTGASLDKSVNTVVRIEDVKIAGNRATVTTKDISKGQFVHVKASDKPKGGLLAGPGRIITPDLLTIMASVGKTSVRVATLPKLVIITSGDELVAPDEAVNDYQIRRSNDQAIYGLLRKYGLTAEMVHVKDDEKLIMQTIKQSVQSCDGVITVGGVSKGKYDYVQSALTELDARQHFHGVAQKPAKPFWFGSLNGKPIFGLPGNPVSVYLSMVRYVIPWLEASLGITPKPIIKAKLDQDMTINPELTHFVLVKTHVDDRACLRAKPVASNNSGDLVSLGMANAFLELPLGRTVHKKDSLHRLWLFDNETIM